MKGMKADKMREILGSHPDFRDERNRIERMLTEEHGHIAYILPKYHCKLNPIERVWAQAKRYSKAYCNYSIVSPCKMLESVPLESINKHFMKVRHYMFACLQGLKGGVELANLVSSTRKQ